MLGLFRYLLALLVTLSHLWSGFAGWSGVMAVFCFYLISGYLMTSVLHESYGFSSRGGQRYALNRFLRIFPTYWAVLLLSLLIVSWIPKAAFMTNFKLSMPLTASDWLPNLFIIGLLDGPFKVLVPPAWSLDVELVFYLLMALGLSRSQLTVTVWFFCSVAYTLLLLITGAEFVDRYASYSASSLPFSLGAMTYIYRGALRRWLCLPVPLSALAFLAALVAERMGWFGGLLEAGFYVVLFCGLLLLVSLNNLDTAKVPARWMRFDTLLGNLAYPIFLCHWQVAAVVLHVVYSGQRPDYGLWLPSIVIINLVGLLVYWLVDRNINRLRDKIRGKDKLDLASLRQSA